MIAAGKDGKPVAPNMTGSTSKRRGAMSGKPVQKVTASSTFRESLRDLVKEFERAKCHYVRCIKPNEDSLPLTFDGKETMGQCRYSGLLETIRIRNIGYPHRYPFQEFVGKHSVLMGEKAQETGDMKAAASQLVEKLGIAGIRKEQADVEELKVAKSLVFFKTYCFFCRKKYCGLNR